MTICLQSMAICELIFSDGPATANVWNIQQILTVFDYFYEELIRNTVGMNLLLPQQFRNIAHNITGVDYDYKVKYFKTFLELHQCALTPYVQRINNTTAEARNRFSQKLWHK